MNLHDWSHNVGVATCRKCGQTTKSCSALCPHGGVEFPPELSELVARCQINEHTFDNDDMSSALYFLEKLFRRVARLADHYEKRSGQYMPGDIRALCDAAGAKDMRDVLMDTVKDFNENR